MKLGMRYSFSYWYGGLLVGAVLSTGCASSALRAQVAEQDSKIRDLQGQLAERDAGKVGDDLVADSKTAAASAWQWGSERAVSMYHTTAEKASACYAATDFTALHTWEDYKNAAERCWDIQPSAENK